MTWARPLILVLALAMPATTAHAGVSGDAYGEVVRLIESLYLRPAEVDGAVLLREGARGLADDVHWLIVESDGRTVYLRHGDGSSIGSLSVASLQTLPEALSALEDLVLAAGHDLGGVDVRLSILQGVTRGLDRYSTVLSGDRLARFDVRLKGTLVGVGLTVNLVDDQLQIVEVTDGGPAELGGVRAGDRLVRIGGVSTVNMPIREASRLIRGAVGTRVVLTVERGGQTLQIDLKRAEIVVPNVEYRVLDGGVGYVRITHFSQRTDENLRLALQALRAEGAVDAGLVIDLRQNTGGSMKDSARSADQFVHRGLLLRTAGSDGGTVRNLQSKMEARSVGDEPDVPLVLLMDHRTASGSEIMAGALAELGRAALVGRRSFGKGTVQKVYPIDAQARLKLTVARYLLAGDRTIDEAGLVPDLAVADVVLDEDGLRLHRFEQDDTGVDHGDVLPVVVEHEGWRGQAVAQGDQRIEVARRAVLRAKGPDRATVLRALKSAAAEVRAEQLAHLEAALTDRGIDWRQVEEPVRGAPPAKAEVIVTATPVVGSPGVLRVRCQVTNLDDAVLERAMVVLQSESFPAWDGVALPVGRLEPGQVGFGSHTVRLRQGIGPREDEVRGVLRVAGRPPASTNTFLLRSGSGPRPAVAVTARLLPVVDDPAGANMRAEVTVHNLSATRLPAVEISFDHPRDMPIELLTQAARHRSLAARGSARMYLNLSVADDAPDPLPLDLTVSSDRYKRPLADWTVRLARDGSALALQAPRIEVGGDPVLAADSGPYSLPLRVRDETRLDHVVVYANGRKVGWAPGGRAEIVFDTAVELDVGENVITVLAEDEHGVVARKVIRIRGEVGATADAE